MNTSPVSFSHFNRPNVGVVHLDVNSPDSKASTDQQHPHVKAEEHNIKQEELGGPIGLPGEVTENEAHMESKDGETTPKQRFVSVTDQEPIIKHLDVNDKCFESDKALHNSEEINIAGCKMEDAAGTISDTDQHVNTIRHNLETDDGGMSSPDTQIDGEKRKENAEKDKKQKHESIGKQRDRSDTMATVVQRTNQGAGSDGNEKSSQQVGDNCPVCLATTAEAVFLTSKLFHVYLAQSLLCFHSYL